MKECFAVSLQIDNFAVRKKKKTILPSVPRAGTGGSGKTTALVQGGHGVQRRS